MRYIRDGRKYAKLLKSLAKRVGARHRGAQHMRPRRVGEATHLRVGFLQRRPILMARLLRRLQDKMSIEGKEPDD